MIIFLGFRPFSSMVNGQDKFGFPSKRTRSKLSEEEQQSWDHFYGCVEDEIQVLIDVCARK